jgi:hypothetical protein
MSRVSPLGCIAALLWGATGASPAGAAVVEASSCSSADVQAAVDLAAEGDIVSIPAGTCTWTAGVTIGEITDWGPPVTIESKALTLQGAGMDLTIIVNEIPRDESSTEDSALMILTLEGKPFRLSGMTFRGGAEGTGDSWHGTVRLGGGCKTWRIDHARFDHLYSRAVETSGDTLGVIDHCEFLQSNWAQFIYIDHGGWGGHDTGDGSWASPLALGTDQAIFMEDNRFEWDGESTPVEAVDCCSGGRFVFRHNEIINTSFGNHGTESTGRGRSCFSWEIYDNTFTRTDPVNRWTLFLARGGTGVMYDNTATGPYDTLAHVANFRDYHPFDPWGACDGTSPYDVNDGTTYDSGTHTGGDGETVLTCDGKSWTPDQWVGYSVHNTTQGRSGIIVGNTATTISVTPDQYSDPLPWNTGDAFTILKAYPCIDQVGRSTGDLLSDWDLPVPQAWPNQALEPFYEWNNTINGEDADIVSDSPHIVENRDYYNDTERPGYAPFTYPHPLTLTTCDDLGGECCEAGQACEGGVFQSGRDCETACCVGGTCAAAPPDATPDASQDTSTDVPGDGEQEEESSGCGCAVVR